MPFVQLLCEVPLNKDTHKFICAEVDYAECVCGGDNHRMHYFTSRSTAVPYMTDSYT